MHAAADKRNGAANRIAAANNEELLLHLGVVFM